ncbi:MAG: hypothetical protein LUH18_04960 [Oscillospiraceae bacterium]|nr:hypothetical protein [Oscillospiraceae bacterium]
MKRTKKLFSLVLAVVLCVCTFTTSLTATEPISTSGLTKNLEISSKLTGTKVYTYTDGDANSIGIYITQSGSVNLGVNSKTNKSSQVSSYAYGVYIEDGGSAIISGGTFSSNNCGIYVAGSNSMLSVSGATVISGNSYTSGSETVNCNVYLDDGALITLRELSSGASIGVTTNTKPTQDSPVQITTAETSTTYYKTALSYLFSDDPNYEIRINETGGYLELCVPAEYDVTIDEDIENGSVTVSSSSARSGATITVTPAAAEGYELDKVTYTYNNGTDDVEKTITADSYGIYSFTMPAYDVTVSATFSKTVVVTEPIDSSGLSVWGSIGGNLGSAYGSSTITSSAYEKIGIYEYGSGNMSLGSACTISGWVYGIYATGNSTLTITGGNYTGNYVGIYIGSNVTFNLSGAPVISGNSYTSGTDTVDCNLYLDDGALITLGELTDGASISVTTTIRPTTGNPVQLTTAETTTEYYKTALSYFSSDDPDYEVRINEEGGYLELCVADYDVTTDQNIENGSVTVSPESAVAGEIVTVTPTAALGYEVDAVTYTYNDGTENITGTIFADSYGIYSFTMPAYAVTVNATFKQSVYPITGEGDENGTVTVSPESSVAGEIVTVTPTAALGYEVDAVTYTYNDGTDDFTETITADSYGIYSFTMPYYATTVNATFKKSIYSVSASSVKNGTVTVSTENASMGDEVTITAIGERLYAVESVTVLDESGNPVSVTDNGDGTYTFTMPAGNVTISVTFYKYAASFSGIIYIDELYHGIFINGSLATFLHTVDANGYCTVCGEYIGIEEAGETEAEPVEETVEIDEPVEGTDIEIEE